ncbi:1946_t:CDS:1, partial [Acaulospora morrowiae]
NVARTVSCAGCKMKNVVTMMKRYPYGRRTGCKEFAIDLHVKRHVDSSFLFDSSIVSKEPFIGFLLCNTQVLCALKSNRYDKVS